MAGNEQKKRKRGQGEGSIYQRADGRWTAAVSLGYQAGKVLRKTYYGKTRKEVADMLTAALNDLNKGLPALDDKRTVKQFLASWVQDVAKPRVRPRTFEYYSYAIDNT